MIASLPMYDWPAVRWATDAWWNGIARHLGISLPLDREHDRSLLWQRSDLLFSQTCGYPLTHEFAGKLRLLATPHYAVDGCVGPTYRSMIFAREQRPLAEFRGCTAAVNNPDSMSGMLALKLVFAPLSKGGTFFGKAIETGAHLNSMLAVRDGKADVCAIDAVCTAMARRYHPEYLEGLVEIVRAPVVPSLPYVTSLQLASTDLANLRSALDRAFADPTLAQARAALFLSGRSTLSEGDYVIIPQLEAEMEAKGGLKLI